MPSGSVRASQTDATRTRILDVALDVLGHDPAAGMGEVAAAAGVVRRTVYGHFPGRAELVRALTERAVTEMNDVLVDVGAPTKPADEVWVDFVARLWPLTRRYRVLLALRRGEYGDEIHALLAPVDRVLADLVTRGQDDGAFTRHLPSDVLGQLAFATVFAVADHDRRADRLGAGSAAMASLLTLGVPEVRAQALIAGPRRRRMPSRSGSS